MNKETNIKPGFYTILPANDFVQSFLSVLTPGKVERGLWLNNDYTFTRTNKYRLHIANNTPAEEVAQFALQQECKQHNRHAPVHAYH